MSLARARSSPLPELSEFKSYETLSVPPDSRGHDSRGHGTHSYSHTVHGDTAPTPGSIESFPAGAMSPDSLTPDSIDSILARTMSSDSCRQIHQVPCPRTHVPAFRSPHSGPRIHVSRLSTIWSRSRFGRPGHVHEVVNRDMILPENSPVGKPFRLLGCPRI